MKLQPTYSDGIGLVRCEWCMHPAVSEADAELLRRNLANIVAHADRVNDAVLAALARQALAVVHRSHLEGSTP